MRFDFYYQRARLLSICESFFSFLYYVLTSIKDFKILCSVLMWKSCLHTNAIISRPLWKKFLFLFISVWLLFFFSSLFQLIVKFVCNARICGRVAWMTQLPYQLDAIIALVMYRHQRLAYLSALAVTCNTHFTDRVPLDEFTLRFVAVLLFRFFYCHSFSAFSVRSIYI